MTRKLKEEYEKWGLAINLEKSKYVCIGEREEILKFDDGEEIKPCTEYLKHVCHITILNMFRAFTCPSSGGTTAQTQHLVSSLS